MWTYTKEGDTYFRFYNGKDKTMIGPVVAVLFDKEDGVLLKIGRSEAVNKYAKTARAALEVVSKEWADNLVVLEGPFPVEEIEKITGISGYIGRFYKKYIVEGQTTEKGDFIDIVA